jgi:hypothetical protein
MNVQFQDSFFKSLKRLSWQESKPYKFYKLFSNDIPLFLKNIWAFRRELWSHQWWDYTFTLMMLKRCIEIQELGMRTKGNESKDSLNKKLERMKRVIELLDNKINSDYIKRTEDKYGDLSNKKWNFEKTESGTYILMDEDTEEQRKHDKMIFDKAHRLELSEWKELWEIIEGKKYKEYKDWDGSGLESWWD